MLRVRSVVFAAFAVMLASCQLATAQPIVKFNCAERQPVAASVQLGVIGDADWVVFDVDGNAAGAATEKNVNPRTGQREFWVTLTNLSAGLHTVTATAYDSTGSVETSVEVFRGTHAEAGWTLIDGQEISGNLTILQGGALYTYQRDSSFTWYEDCDVLLDQFVQFDRDGIVRVFNNCRFYGVSAEGPTGRTTWNRDRALKGSRTYIFNSTMDDVYFALPNIEVASNVTIDGVSADVMMNAVAATGIYVENVNYALQGHHPDGAQRFVSIAGTDYPLFIWQDSEIRGASSMQGMYTDQYPRPARYLNCYVSNVRIENDGVGFTQFHQENINTRFDRCVWVGTPFAFKNINSPAPFVADGFTISESVIGSIAYDDVVGHSVWGLPPGVTLDRVAIIDPVTRAALTAQGHVVVAPVAGDVFPYAATLAALAGPTYDPLADTTTTGAASGELGYGEPDGFVTAGDLLYFQGLWSQLDPAADLTTQGAGEGEPGWMVPDGEVTAGDIGVFVNRWQAANGSQAVTP